jgi:hypothetical protein
MARKQKALTLRAVKANPGIRASYRKQLDVMLRQMHEDYMREVDAEYGALEFRIAGDAKWRSPMERMTDILDRLTTRWTSRFATFASMLSRRTVTGILSRVRNARKQELKDFGFNIQIPRSRVMDERVQALIQANATDIESLPLAYSSRVAKLVSNAVASGMDRATLVSDLHKGLGIGLRKAKNIARDQTNKSTQALAQVEDEEIGFTEGTWIHVPGRKTSRPTHIRMDGKRFNLKEGLYDSEVKRNVTPGSLWLCACTYRPVIPESWKVN